MPVRTADIDMVADLKDKASKKIDQIEKKTKSAGKSMEKSFVGVDNAIKAIGLDKLAEGLKKFGDRASDVQKVEAAFNATTEAAGIHGDTLINKVEAATNRLIPRYEIMLATNKAMALGLNVTEESMASLGEQAVVMGQRMGVSAQQALDDYITGLGRGSVQILDNLGITVKAKSAYEAYASSLGKAVKDLTDSEKKQAILNAAISQGEKAVKEMGGATITFNDRLDQMKVRIQNGIDSLSEILGPAASFGGSLASVGSQVAIMGAVWPGAFGKVGIAIRGVGAALLTPPLGIAVAIATVVAGVGLLISKMFKASDATQKLEERTRSLTLRYEEMKIAVSKLGEEERKRTVEEAKARIKEINLLIRKGKISKEDRKALQEERRELRANIKAIENTEAAVKDLNEEEKKSLRQLNEIRKKGGKLTKEENERLEKALKEIYSQTKDNIELDQDHYQWQLSANAKRIQFYKDLESAAKALAEANKERQQSAIDGAVAFAKANNMLLGPPGKAPKDTRKVADNFKTIASSLTTVVAGGTIGGIFNSVIQGDWVGAALQGVNSLFGGIKSFFGGRSEKQRNLQEQARKEAKERIRLWEEEQQAIKDAFQEWKDGFKDVAEAALEAGGFTDDLLRMLDEMPDHIDVGAIRGQFKEAFANLDDLMTKKEGLQAILSMVGDDASVSALEQFAGGDRSKLNAAAIEYVNTGGDAQKFIDYGLAKIDQERFEELKQAYENAAEEEKVQAEQNLIAFLDANGIQASNIIEAINKGQEHFGNELTRTADILEKDVKITLANVVSAIDAQTQAIVDAINNIDMKPTVIVNVDGGDRETERGDGDIPGAASGGYASGGLVKVHKDEIIDFNRTGPGTVIPLNRMGKKEINITVPVEVDGYEIARVNAKYESQVADEEGW